MNNQNNPNPNQYLIGHPSHQHPWSFQVKFYSSFVRLVFKFAVSFIKTKIL